jgi:hypothetical protein
MKKQLSRAAAPSAAALSLTLAAASDGAANTPETTTPRPAAAPTTPQTSQDTSEFYCWHCGGSGVDTGFTPEEADNPAPCLFCGGTGRSDEPMELSEDEYRLILAHRSKQKFDEDKASVQDILNVIDGIMGEVCLQAEALHCLAQEHPLPCQTGNFLTVAGKQLEGVAKIFSVHTLLREYPELRNQS